MNVSVILPAVLEWGQTHSWTVLTLAWYLVASLVVFALYGYDKFAAITRRWRIPENTLHLWEVFGGWPGALVAQRVFRHKTVKPSYRSDFWICVLFNMFLLEYLFWGRMTGDWRLEKLQDFWRGIWGG